MELQTSSRTVYFISCVTYGEREVYLKTLYDSWSRKQGNLNLLYQLVAKVPWPRDERSFEYFENLCVIRELLNNATIPSGVYQVADDESLSTNKLIALLSGS
jgi:hypothetical protein